MPTRVDRRAWLAAVVVGTCLLLVTAAHAARDQLSVLVLVPGQPGLPAGAAIASGIRDVLLTDWAFRVTIETEHVDVARFASPEVEERRLRSLYGTKYRNQHFDVVIAALPEPLHFVLRARDELWPGTPVVVCGVDERTVRAVMMPPGVAVLTIRFDMEGTVRAARDLLPGTRHVALVGGASQPEQVYHDLIREAVSAVGGLDVIDLTRLPLAQVLARVANLPERTVIVQSSYQVDGAGRRFHGIDLVPHVSHAANRPVFTPLGLALGRGVVGGSILEFEDIGRDAGALASRILRGEAPPLAPVPGEARSMPRFDGRQLARWHLDPRRLPPDSEVIFPQLTLWQAYRWQVVGVVGVIAAEAALILALIVQRRRRREAQSILSERLRFETLVSDVISACATATLDQVDARIRDGLRRVVTYLGVDRGSLWRRTQDNPTVSITHFWQRDGVPSPPLRAHLLSFPYFRDRTEAGATVCFASVDELPREASAERAACATAGVRSFAAIPLLGGGHPVAVLVLVSLLAERPWPDHVLQQLQTLAEAFAAALTRVQSAAAVASSAAMASAVLAALPGETAIIDAEGTILQTNDAWTAAVRSQPGAEAALKIGANYLEACGKAIDIPPEVGRALQASIESVLRAERDDVAMEYPVSRHGEDRWFEVRVRRLARLGGGAAVMHFDVTARRQAEASAQRHLGELAHLDRVAGMGQLASSIAHELNQPLTGILANAQAAERLMARPAPNVEELRACVADIIDDDRRAAEVIRRMRHLLRKTEFVSVPLALNELTASTIDLVANDALLHAVTIQFSPAAALPIVYGDSVQIQQVILNLLTNAITAAAGSAARKVTVWTCVVEAPYVEVGVHDSGPGITDADFGRIFEPFFTTKPDGLGMGLAISRTIVEAHGGRILVQNDPAAGATFRLHFRTDASTAG